MTSPLVQNKIVDLLREREAEFARVWECESRIEEILGEAYPFPDPPPLPSTTRSSKARRGTDARSAVPRTIRQLRSGDENAYCVLYEAEGATGVSFQTDHRFLSQLLDLQIPEFRVLAVDTVRFRALRDYDVIDTIWQAEGPPSDAD
jgi:hypothetical protein